ARGALPPGRAIGVLVPSGAVVREVVVRLDVVRAVVAGLAEILREALHARRQYALAAHMLRAHARGVHPKNQTRPRRRTHADRREGPRVTDALGREPIEIW